MNISKRIFTASARSNFSGTCNSIRLHYVDRVKRCSLAWLERSKEEIEILNLRFKGDDPPFGKNVVPVASHMYVKDTGSLHILHPRIPCAAISIDRLYTCADGDVKFRITKGNMEKREDREIETGDIEDVNKAVSEFLVECCDMSSISYTAAKKANNANPGLLLLQEITDIRHEFVCDLKSAVWERLTGVIDGIDGAYIHSATRKMQVKDVIKLSEPEAEIEICDPYCDGSHTAELVYNPDIKDIEVVFSEAPKMHSFKSLKTYRMSVLQLVEFMEKVLSDLGLEGR